MAVAVAIAATASEFGPRHSALGRGDAFPHLDGQMVDITLIAPSRQGCHYPLQRTFLSKDADLAGKCGDRFCIGDLDLPRDTARVTIPHPTLTQFRDHSKTQQ